MLQTSQMAEIQYFKNEITPWPIFVFFPHFLAVCSLIASSYDNDFVLPYSTERIEKKFSL